MNDCSNHKKEVAGVTDMKILAEMIGDLHYETLKDLLFRLSTKLYRDGLKDKDGNRSRLSYELTAASDNMQAAAENIKEAWQISKPFMSNSEQSDKVIATQQAMP